jgi:hypothetical protein
MSNQKKCKSIALLRKRADITHDAFVAYYETKHAPLIRSLFPGLIVDYRRNYCNFAGAFHSEGAAPFDFDVITELWFADRAAYDLMIEKSATPEIMRAIAEDEENLFDRSCTRMFLVEETPPV